MYGREAIEYLGLNGLYFCEIILIIKRPEFISGLLYFH